MILNGKPFNVGELRTRVNLGTRTVTPSAGGFGAVTYTAFASVWARWTNAHGSEAVQAAAAGAEQLATVLVRYDARLTSTGAIQKDGEWWEIVSPDDIQERHEWIECKVKRVRAG